MKFNKNKKNQSEIKKLQTGGYLPGASGSIYAPAIIQPRQLYAINPFEQVFQKPDLSQYKGLSATIASKVEAKGLTSDVNQYLSGLSQLQAVENQLTDLDILANSEKFQAYKQLANNLSDPRKVNELRINEEAFDKAQGVIESKKSQSAFTTNGNSVLVFDGEKLDYVSVEQYASAPQNYRIMTNQEALQLRRDQLPGDNSILTATTRTEGIDAIQEHLEKRMANLGSTESKTKREGLIATAQAITNGQIRGYDGWESHSKNNKQAVEALDITWHYLNEDQKTQLKLMAVRQFGVTEPEKIEQMAKVAMSLVFAKGVQISNANALKSSDDFFGFGSGGGSNRQAEIGTMEQAVGGFLKRGQQVTLNSGNTKLTTNSAAAYIPALEPGKDWKTTGKIGDDNATITGKVPFNATFWNEIAGNVRTIDGQAIDPNLLIVDKTSDNGVLGFEIQINGITVDSFSNDPQMKAVQDTINEGFAKIPSGISPADRRAMQDQIQRAAIEKTFGRGAARTYKPVLYYEVIAAELEGTESAKALRKLEKQGNSKILNSSDAQDANVVLSAVSPSLTNQFDRGLLDFSGSIDNFHKIVVKADLKEGALNIARSYDGERVTVSPQLEQLGARTQMSGSYQGGSGVNPNEQVTTGRFSDFGF